MINTERIEPSRTPSKGKAVAATKSKSFKSEKQRELAVFLVLAVLLAPVLAVGAVGSFGFSIWMYQLIAGPPGSSATIKSH